MKTTFDHALTAAAVLLTVCVVAISGYLLLADVGQKWTYAVAIVIMAAGWLARRFTSERNVTASITMAGVLLSVALGAKAVDHAGWLVINDLALRINGMVTGAVLVLLSNAIPKRMSSATGLAMLRTVGTAFVIGGFGYALAWLVLPVHFADAVAPIVVLLSLIVALTAYIIWYRGGARSVS